jgi:hypothetical protein
MMGFSALHHRVQTGSGDHSASFRIGTRGSFPRGLRRPGCESDHLHLMLRLRMRGAIPSTLPICLHGVVLNKVRDNFLLCGTLVSTEKNLPLP